MKLRSLSVLVAAVAVLVLAVPVAHAYRIFGTWGSDSVGMSKHSSLPSSFVDAQQFAATQWNDVANTSFRLSHQPGSKNKVSYGAIDGSLGTLAVTTAWVTLLTGRITEADVEYDQAENWYTGSGSPGGSQVDLRAVSTHEFGHVAGLDHTQNGNCPGNSNDATMCPYYTLGSTYTRTLETDDRNGLVANYPTRAGPKDPFLQSVAGSALQRVLVHALYAAAPDRVLAGATTTAFVGEVVSVSPARWNSDDGTLAEADRAGGFALAYHQVRFRVLERIRGAAGDAMTITVLGASPAGSVDGTLSGHPEHGLRAGERMLVLATTSPLGWSDGSERTITRFVASPDHSTAAVGSSRFGTVRALLG